MEVLYVNIVQSRYVALKQFLKTDCWTTFVPEKTASIYCGSVRSIRDIYVFFEVCISYCKSNKILSSHWRLHAAPTLSFAQPLHLFLVQLSQRLENIESEIDELKEALSKVPTTSTTIKTTPLKTTPSK